MKMTNNAQNKKNKTNSSTGSMCTITAQGPLVHSLELQIISLDDDSEKGRTPGSAKENCDTSNSLNDTSIIFWKSRLSLSETQNYANLKKAESTCLVIEETVAPPPIAALSMRDITGGYLRSINVPTTNALGIKSTNQPTNNRSSLPTPPITPNRSRSSTMTSEEEVIDEMDPTLPASPSSFEREGYINGIILEDRYPGKQRNASVSVGQSYIHHTNDKAPLECSSASSTSSTSSSGDFAFSSSLSASPELLLRPLSLPSKKGKAHRHSIQPIRIDLSDHKINGKLRKQKAGSVSVSTAKTAKLLACRDVSNSSVTDKKLVGTLPRVCVPPSNMFQENLNPYLLTTSDPLTRKSRRSTRAASASNALGVGDEEREMILMIEHERRLEWEEKLQKWNEKTGQSGSQSAAARWERDSGYGSLGRSLPKLDRVNSEVLEATPWSGGWGSGTGAHDIPYIRPSFNDKT